MTLRTIITTKRIGNGEWNVNVMRVRELNNTPYENSFITKDADLINDIIEYNDYKNGEEASMSNLISHERFSDVFHTVNKLAGIV